MRMIKEFIVNVGFLHFRFDDADDAMNFAQVAADRSIDKVYVDIVIVTEGDESEEEDDEQAGE